MDKIGPFIAANKDNVLEVDGIAVTALAAQYGTPLFVLSENTIRDNYRRIHGAFSRHYPNEVIVCAGMKGNWGLAARRVIVEEGGGGDAFGLGELTVAMLAGSDPRKIVINGANKSREVIAAAIDVGVLNQVDNADELALVQSTAAELGKKARVSLRIRLPLAAIADVKYVDRRYPDGISPSFWERTFKFGMDPTAFTAAVRTALTMTNVSLEGAMYHGGIPRRAGFFREETEELVDCLAEVRRQTGWEPRFLNIGGGFVPERYGADIPPTIDEYASVISTAILGRCAAHGLTVPVLLMEPGRYCWDSAGVWITQVGARKQDNVLASKTWIYVDGNTNEMGDPFDPRCGVHHVVIANDMGRTGSEVVDICGQTCNAADVLAKQRGMPPVRAGDLLAFLDMGAYNESFAHQSNAIPRSATVMVANGRSALVRRRETVADVLSRELVPNWLLARSNGSTAT
jgi:diaminopimelate decarboxylase